MRNRIIAGLVLAAALVAPVFADSPFVGKWTATAAAPTGPAAEIVTVTQTGSGYAITAKLVNPAPQQPEAGPGHDIVLEGDQFTYKRTVTVGTTDIVITYTGVISGDTFTGTVEMAGFKMGYTGVRIKDGA
jgi:hypothetical protein